MEVVILKTDGTPVKLSKSLFASKLFDIDGFLIGFSLKDGSSSYNYRHYQPSEFRKEDKHRLNLEGYYAENQFLRYLQRLNAAPTIEELISKFKFNFNDFKVGAGEPITISRIDFGLPYAFYYREHTYFFDIENTADDVGVRSYKKGVYEYQKLVGYEINVPFGVKPVVKDVDLLKHPTGYFYTKNFGDYVNGWTINDDEKVIFKKRITLIAFKINYIVQDVIQKILDAESLAVIEATANSTDPDLSHLTDLEKLVFDLKKKWGYFYKPTSDPSLIHQHTLEPIFSSQPHYDEYLYYYNSLLNFYDKAYKKRDKLLLEPEGTRLRYLLEILPISSLKLIPLDLIQGTLEDFIKKGSASQNEEQFIVRLVVSVRIADANNFLKFLLVQPNDYSTNFEAIYHLLSDARVERITIINWFVEQATNRKYFAYAVHELWKLSIYNMNYLPPWITPVFGSINPEAYFITHPEEFNTRNVFDFDVFEKSELGIASLYSSATFSSSFTERGIKISEQIRTVVNNPLRNTTSYQEPVFIGDYHLYHPITLFGYKPSLDLVIPEGIEIPAFLFQFAHEYTELVAFDAAISLAVDITLEAILFYFTGGFSLISDLRYLQYFTKLGRALKGLEPATETIRLWRGLEAGTSTFDLLSSSVMAVNEYLITTETDPVKRRNQEDLRWMFIGLLVLSGGTNFYAANKTVNLATTILKRIGDTSQSIHGIPLDVKNLLITIVGDAEFNAASLGNAIGNLDVGVGKPNYIKQVYDSLIDVDKQAFYKDFYKLVDNDALKKEFILLNNSGKNTDILNNWIDLNARKIAESGDVRFLTNQKLVDSIKRFYEVPRFRNKLESLSKEVRAKFLDWKNSEDYIDDLTFEALKSKANEGIDLILQAKFPPQNLKSNITLPSAIKIIKSSLNSDFISVLVHGNEIIWRNLRRQYVKAVNRVENSLERTKSLNELFTAGMTRKLKDKFQSKNRLFVKLKIYRNGSLVDEGQEIYISGNKYFLESLGDLKTNFVELNWDEYKIFSAHAYDISNNRRFNDTELKFIYNFMKNHFSRGDRFEITMESILYSCSSCQRYLTALEKYAKVQNKVIECDFLSMRYVEKISDL